jgi:hypothetical protein
MNAPFQGSAVKDDEQARLAQEILGALKGIRYGTVEIVVHDGAVTRIDRHERIRVSGGAQH